MRITLLRHGETDWNRQRRIQGQADVELSDLGRRQARQVAERWKGAPFEAIYSSPLKRAAETASIVRADRGIDISFDDRLKEINCGSWAGLTFAEVAERDPQQAKRYAAGLDFRRSATGETSAEVAARSAAALTEIARQHSGDVLVVTHGYLMQLAISQLIGIPGFGSSLKTPGNVQHALLRFNGRWLLEGYGLGG
ncbi:histidine phosphatase family protein [Tessaracoccus sp. OH4464_COT-324]|uniref:histidine phosphatase family protein n=1 Tax=Tessaracoccus sp. OH4464_COT-324 TaxID=2491059 RepID=UPI0018F53795|nr:histidine phosphatase family protein [Tessaracoccus sp. OH4464_COT-324]